MNRERNINRIFIISVIIAIVLIITLIGVLIAKGTKKANEDNFARDLSIIGEEKIDTESASTDIGKSIQEAEEQENDEEFEEAEVIENKKTENTTNKNTKVSSSNKEKNTSENSKKNENKTTENKTVETNAKPEKEEKIEFEAPVKGEILREFAKESLVFSNTLQEWITHNGVDIKADKTSVVKAAEKGTVSAIKNDPRYGLTVIINHDNGYQTIYANLLTAEFVVKGEKVEKGQTIGTVGNSASFESLDDYHLHFELLQNNNYLDPSVYMSFE